MTFVTAHMEAAVLQPRADAPSSVTAKVLVTISVSGTGSLSSQACPKNGLSYMICIIALSYTAQYLRDLS